MGERTLELEAIAHSHVCAECGSLLVLPWDREQNRLVLHCGEDKRHIGTHRITQKSEFIRRFGPEAIKIWDEIYEQERRKELQQQIGQEKSTALAKYHGVTSLTKQEATEILLTIWPGAPAVEVYKGAMLCAQYGLNPLMKHVYLIPFDSKGGKTWATVMGINATRLLATRAGRYSYKDGPRMMTQDEETTIFGEVDNTKFRAITILEDNQGNEYPGYGDWPRDKQPYGTDKGNSKANMAFIRSERAALNRRFPGDMPTGVDVISEEYAPNGPVDKGTGEIIEGELSEVTEAEATKQASKGTEGPSEFEDPQGAEEARLSEGPTQDELRRAYLFDLIMTARGFKQTATAYNWLTDQCHRPIRSTVDLTDEEVEKFIGILEGEAK